MWWKKEPSRRILETQGGWIKESKSEDSIENTSETKVEENSIEDDQQDLI